jgi:hypothetical protein
MCCLPKVKGKKTTFFFASSQKMLSFIIMLMAVKTTKESPSFRKAMRD